MKAYGAAASGINRRDFLVRASAGAAAAAASMQAREAGAEAARMPEIALGGHHISRLLAGYNPVGGYSHYNATYSQIMRDWFTVERTVEFLRECERQGITAFQFDITDKTKDVLKALWEGGSKLKFICLHRIVSPAGDLDEVMKYQPIAIVHHGGETDQRFRTGRAGDVRDFVKQVRDHGVLAGVSTHCPAHLQRMEEEDWETDLYMACFHYVTRTREEVERELRFVPVGGTYIESDRDAMTAVIRQINKPCLGFKILAAGRRCNGQDEVAAAFEYAFKSIKPADAVIVGMFPYVQDEIKLNIGHTLKYGALA